MERHRFAVALAGAGAVLATSVGLSMHAHAAGPVARYAFSPSPLAPAGTLAANATVAVTMTAEDGTNTPVPGATVFLYITSAGGSASVGATGLTKTPVAFAADSSGNIAITYTAAATPPATGIDKITAKNAASGATVTGHVEYSYSGIHKYALRPKPIAAAGALAGGATVTINLTAVSSTGGAVPNATVYLDFSQAAGGGSATVGSTTLTSSPTKFTTSSSGTLKIVYHAPLVPPTAGTDTITADNAATHSSVSSTDSYTF